jgi:hypothetical protein
LKIDTYSPLLLCPETRIGGKTAEGRCFIIDKDEVWENGMDDGEQFPCFTIMRTSSKPWRDKIAQTSFPERTRSLPNRHLYLSYKYFAVNPQLDFLGRCRFEK